MTLLLLDGRPHPTPCLLTALTDAGVNQQGSHIGMGPRLERLLIDYGASLRSVRLSSAR